MAVRAAAVRQSGGAGLDNSSSFPPWIRWAVAALALALLVTGLGFLFYRSLDALYPQELWRYFRPLPPPAAGSVLYRDPDGQLHLSPIRDPGQARRLRDPSLGAEAREIVRDAAVLPDGKHVAYFATERRDGQPDSDRLKVLALDGGLVRNLAVAAAAGEPIRPAVYVSASGRYVAVTSRDRAHVYYYDVTSDGPLVVGPADAAPEGMLWNRNADLRTPLLPGQPAFATSPDGTRRAQVRPGTRRAPACAEAECEAVQELVVASRAGAGSGTPAAAIYSAFSGFSAEGWGPIPAQPAQRFYGRLVWSPDGKQLLFSTLDGAEVRTYTIGTDGRTRPRLVLEAAEALDWIP
jgi:hypothetical protein